MKKLVVIFVAILICSKQVAFGQLNKFSIGIMGGPNYGLYYGKQSPNAIPFNASFGISAGVFVQYNWLKKVSLVSGLYYEAKRGHQTGIVTDAIGKKIGDFKNNITFNYITLPLLARLLLDKNNRFFVEGGGFVSYLANVTQRISMPDFKVTTYRTSQYKVMDFGIALGLGVNIPLTEKLGLTLVARNNLGLCNVSKFLGFDGRRNINSTMLLLGLRYKLAK